MGVFDLFRRPAQGGPFAVRARLEGAMARRRLRGWNPPLENINALVASGGPRLLARARELVVTNGYAANACEAFASNLVGDGIKPSSLIGDADVRDRVQKLWSAWIDEADAGGMTDFYGLQAMVAREMFVAGECFVRLRPRRAEDGLLVPLQMQLLQSGMLPCEKTGAAANGNRLRCGIEFDRIGRRVAYHFRRRHPGDSTDQRVAIPETVRVPAGDVLHIYRPIAGDGAALSAGSVRGRRTRPDEDRRDVRGLHHQELARGADARRQFDVATCNLVRSPPATAKSSLGELERLAGAESQRHKGAAASSRGGRVTWVKSQWKLCAYPWGSKVLMLSYFISIRAHRGSRCAQ